MKIRTLKNAKRRRILTAAFLIICFLCYPRARAVLAAFARKTCDINVLLLGVDEREGDRGRTDTIMLLHYNARRNTMHLMSIPRDTRIHLAKYGYQKVNASYPLGGADLAKQAVSGLTGLHIDYYVKTNLEGFEAIVDAMGGVYIEVERSMKYTDPYQNLHIDLAPGMQHLSGKQALDYVRWRQDARADLGRVERQRVFMKAAVRRLLSPGTVIRAPRIVSTLRRVAETDIPVLIRPGMAFSMGTAYIKGVGSSTMPGSTATIGGVSYFLADQDETSAQIALWDQSAK